MAATISTNPEVSHQVKRLFYNKSQMNSSEQQQANLMERMELADKRKREEEDKTYMAIVEQQKKYCDQQAQEKDSEVKDTAATAETHEARMQQA